MDSPSLPEFEQLLKAAALQVLRLLPLGLFALPWLIPSLVIDLSPLFMSGPVNFVTHTIAEGVTGMIALIGMVELFRRSCFAALGAPLPHSPQSLPSGEQWHLVAQAAIVLVLVMLAAFILTGFMISSLPGTDDVVLFWAIMVLWPMGRLAGLVLAYDLLLRLPGTATDMPSDRLMEAVDKGRGMRFMIALGLTVLIWPLDAFGAAVQYVLTDGPGSVPFIMGDKIPAEGLPTFSVPSQVLETLMLPVVTICAAVWLSGWLRILDSRKP
ncbi:MAG: hypothetical protein Alpg2KO_23190 [Alphaproteobacteria bacterium]